MHGVQAHRAVALCFMAAAACGNVTLVPAPFTPTNVDLEYSATEDVTRLRWQVARNSDALRFELLAGTQTIPIDLAAAPFAAGAYACEGGATCFQWTRRGAVSTPARIVASHAQYGRFPSQVAPLQTVARPVTFTAELSDDNGQLNVQVDDWLETAGPKRSFSLTLWPSDDATCAAAGGAPVATVGHAQSLPFTGTSASGRYCTAVQPIAGDHGAQATFVAPLVTNPELTKIVVRYTPPSETAPVVWRLMTDLDIVTPERCQQVHDRLEAVLRTALGQADPAQAELPAVELSPGCAQAPVRSFSAPALAEETKQYLAQHSTNVFQRPLLVYVNNLAAPPPMALANSFMLYLQSFPDTFVRPILVAVTPSPLTTGAVPFDLMLPYADPDDAQFVASVNGLVRAQLPLETQLTDSSDRTPLLSSTDLNANLGALWKLCDSAPPIVRLLGDVAVPDGTITAVVSASAPPTFSVTLPPKIAIPRSTFHSDTVVIRNELCHRWCDHPFHVTDGPAQPSWSTSASCQRVQ
jgi:hypothetical protein